MPRPGGDRSSGSPACADCPLRGKSPSPVVSCVVSFPDCLVICDHPGPEDLITNQPFASQIGKRFVSELSRRGIVRKSVVYRVACYPNTIAKRTDSALARAAKCCRERFDKDRAAADPDSRLPTLLLGKHSANGWLGAYDWQLTSGATSRVPIAKLAAGIAFDRFVALTHPRVPFWHKTPSQPQWFAGLDRFADLVHGRKQVGVPVPLIDVSEDALGMLGRMGRTIGWDVETLGKDPLSCPITCIGISDGIHTVSVPWDSYDTQRQGTVRGVVDAHGDLGVRIRQAVLDILSSDRTQVTQNGTYDVLAMESKGLPGRNDWDIMHAYKILWPEIPANLEAIGVHLLSSLDQPGLDHRWKSVFRSGRDDDAKGSDVFTESAEHDLRWYNAHDAWVTAAAQPVLGNLLAQED